MDADEPEIVPRDVSTPEVYVNETDPLAMVNDVEVDKTQTEINHNDAVQEIIDVDDESEGAPNNINGLDHSVISTESVWKPGQIPEPYSEEELTAYPTILGDGYQSVQFFRLHCTACNAHLGSAPSNQQNRYIHPLLNVLICKDCFDFYGSGDFDKDEDGSELYCRWCGQGGKVLCCAQCPFVFCQKCIRVNQGKKALDAVLHSDDWLCYVCNSKQIMRQRITCRALYDYVKKEFETWQPLNRSDMLEVDKSLCCKSRGPSTPKRKSTNEEFVVDSEKKAKKKKLCINPLSKKLILKKISLDSSIATPNVNCWETRPQDEVVCTPDLLMIMDYDDGSEPTVVEETEENVNESEVLSVSTPASVNEIEETPTITTKTKLVSKRNRTKSKLDSVSTKKDSGVKKLSNKSSRKTNQNVLNMLPNLMPESTYECFDKITQATAQVNQNLNSKICALSNEQKSITTIEDFAKMHNDLQDILSGIIQSFVEIKKNLRTDFIKDLKNLKFVDNDKNNKELESSQDDNDVIVIDPVPTEPVIEPVPISNALPQQTVTVKKHISVKPPSELLTPSAIAQLNLIKLTEAQPKNIDPPIPVDVPNKEVIEAPDKINNGVPASEPLSQLATKNLQSIKTNISQDFLKQMATVRVVLDKKLGSNTIHSHSCKEYKPFKIIIRRNTDEGYCTKEVPCPSSLDFEQQKLAKKQQINGIDS